MSTDNREVIDRLEYALRRNDISILWHSNYYAQYTSKEDVNVYSESSLNMPTNERKITTLLPRSYATHSQAIFMDNTLLVVSVRSLPFLPQQNTSPRRVSVQIT